MKVLMAAPHANLLIAGGASVQLAQTKKYLPQFGIEVDYFSPWQPYRKEDFDLIHIFDANPATHDLALRLYDLKVKFVVSTIFYTLHRPWFLRFARKVERLSKRGFKGIWTDYSVIAEICRASEAVLPNTSEEASLIEKGMAIPRHKIHLVPNGVERRFYHADPSLFIKTYGRKDFILNVANIGSFRKNALNLIRALKKIDHPAVIIGKVYQNRYASQCLREAAKNKNLLIIDGLPHDSPMLESAYAASEVFASPAHFETPGIAALEAALSGSKIVITRHGGTKDYFHDQAHYLEPTSVASIKKAIEQALNHPHDSSLRERIYREYLWEKVAEKTSAVYRQVKDTI